VCRQLHDALLAVDSSTAARRRPASLALGAASEGTQILNPLLADEYLLYTKTRNDHGNVVGPQFNDPHTFFEAQYEELDAVVDDVAEGARALGGRAVATLDEFARQARLEEHPGKYPDAVASLPKGR
jgi:DNA-binding ferritin-like protein